MTGLAIHLFYEALNARSDTSCERYFRYDVDSPSQSVESGRALRDNHLVGFSLTYEEDIIGVLQMLKAGGIPLLASKRDDNNPIVIMGGPVVTANPVPFQDFIDAFVIGEGDEVIHRIIDCVINEESRADVLESVAKLEGVYVPLMRPTRVKRLFIGNIDEASHPLSQIVPDVPEGSSLEPVFGRTFLAEVARGCGHSCKFCLIGHICNPRRVRSLDRLKEIIAEGLRRTPVNKVSLIASSLGDLDRLSELARWIVDGGRCLSVPSLRADTVTTELLQSLTEGGQRTLAIAPETGSERLRREIGKGLNDRDIIEAAKCAAQTGYRSLKLYYIVGLPGEDEDDVREIVRQVKQISDETPLRVTASVNPFIPKAHTRYERHAQQNLETIRRKIRLVCDGLRNVPRAKIEHLDPRRARVQAALSLGDESIGRVIQTAAKYGGLSGWRRAEKETGVAFFDLATNSERLQGRLPWDFIDIRP